MKKNKKKLTNTRAAMDIIFVDIGDVKIVHFFLNGAIGDRRNNNAIWRRLWNWRNFLRLARRLLIGGVTTRRGTVTLTNTTCCSSYQVMRQHGLVQCQRRVRFVFSPFLLHFHCSGVFDLLKRRWGQM